jgi:hypothetical protein
MRADVADHGAQRSRNEHADPVAEVRLGSESRQARGMSVHFPEDISPAGVAAKIKSFASSPPERRRQSA